MKNGRERRRQESFFSMLRFNQFSIESFYFDEFSVDAVGGSECAATFQLKFNFHC